MADFMFLVYFLWLQFFFLPMERKKVHTEADLEMNLSEVTSAITAPNKVTLPFKRSLGSSQILFCHIFRHSSQKPDADKNLEN